MSLPVFLPYNIVSIYGIGSSTGGSGIVPPTGYLFGNIDQVSQYDIVWAKVGDSVLFKDEDIQCRLAYPPDNTSYTLVEEVKLVVKEYIVP